MHDLSVDMPAEYELRVQGELPSNRFDGLTVCYEHPITTISGTVKDQSALLGIIRQLINHGYPLLTVRYIANHTAEEAS